jgi:glycosyltransferase involved in cell wall biosynthesis
MAVARVGDPAPSPPPLRSEDEIVARWRGSDPVVSCLCHTYNQVGFIGDALRGMLGQRTDFPFEIVVHDDASSDGTTDVVRDFAARYPRVVRPIFQSVNQYAVSKPIAFTLPAARGEFVAWCEGDDYWMDPLKLERQVALLRGDAAAVLCHHDALTVEGGTVTAAHCVPAPSRADLGPDALQRGLSVPTATWLFRRAALTLDFLPYCRTPVTQDWFVLSVLGLRGGARFAAGIEPSVYRVHPGGVWSTRPVDERRIIKAQTHYWLHLYHRERSGATEAADHLLERALVILAGGPTPLLKASWRSLSAALGHRFRARAG